MTKRTVAAFLTPEGFSQPSVAAVLREGSMVTEAGRYAVHALGARGTWRRTPYASRPPRVTLAGILLERPASRLS